MRLIDDITLFLESNGFECSRQVRDGFDVICVRIYGGKQTGLILPLEINSESAEDAVRVSDAAYEFISSMRSDGDSPLVIAQDRWHSQNDMMKKRLLAHLEIFSQAFARNCEVRRIEKVEAKSFLQSNHSYGDAACKYRYGLFLKRQTGALASGTLIAVATFSNARRWMKGDKEIRSYEWTRFASLPGMRISGGVGKILKTFIDEVRPDDVMSYADLEWSEGNVYEILGFEKEGKKEPVMFTVDTRIWKRTPFRPGGSSPVIASEARQSFFCNFGSNKYRLKLTDYE